MDSSGDCFVSSTWFLLFTGYVAMGPKVTHCQFVQGIQSCCFHQVAAMLPYSCNSGGFLPQYGGAIQF
jgi:hypothetical protein